MARLKASLKVLPIVPVFLVLLTQAFFFPILWYSQDNIIEAFCCYLLEPRGNMGIGVKCYVNAGMA